eukprot:2486400-Karenia_brevis.AAC.1
MGSSSWTVLYRRRKWAFAGHIARTTDPRWSRWILNWIPNHGAGRDVGHPFNRWDNDICQIAGRNWT